MGDGYHGCEGGHGWGVCGVVCGGVGVEGGQGGADGLLERLDLTGVEGCAGAVCVGQVG